MRKYLASTHPKIAKMWLSCEKPQKTPKNTTAGSAVRVTFRCDKYKDHIWVAPVYRLATDGQGCPFCVNRRISARNNLQALHPEIAALFYCCFNDASKRPRDILATSKDSCYWKCPCGIKYRRNVYDMVHHGPGCVDCRRKARRARADQRALQE